MTRICSVGADNYAECTSSCTTHISDTQGANLCLQREKTGCGSLRPMLSWAWEGAEEPEHRLQALMLLIHIPHGVVCFYQSKPDKVLQPRKKKKSEEIWVGGR